MMLLVGIPSAVVCTCVCIFVQVWLHECVGREKGGGGEGGGRVEVCRKRIMVHLYLVF